jgi:hypothetical protein
MADEHALDGVNSERRIGCLLRLGGERCGEKATGHARDECTSVHHSIT